MATYDSIINNLDEEKPNVYPLNRKMIWLNNLEQQIKTNIFDTHENPPEGADNISFDFSKQIEEQSKKELLVPETHDELYIHYLAARIDYANGEFEKYNNSNAMYEAAYSAFSNYYNRTHRPISGSNNYF